MIGHLGAQAGGEGERDHIHFLRGNRREGGRERERERRDLVKRRVCSVRIHSSSLYNRIGSVWKGVFASEVNGSEAK